MSKKKIQCWKEAEEGHLFIGRFLLLSLLEDLYRFNSGECLFIFWFFEVMVILVAKIFPRKARSLSDYQENCSCGKRGQSLLFEPIPPSPKL